MDTPEIHFTLQPDGIANAAREKLMSLQNSALLTLRAVEQIPDGTPLGLSATTGVHFTFNEPPQASSELRSKAERWIVVSALEDGFDILIDACDEAWRMCVLAEAGTGPLKITDDVSQVSTLRGLLEALPIGAKPEKFEYASVEKKFQELSKRFGITFSWRDEIDSLRLFRNCLAHRLGVVQAVDCNAERRLSLKLRRLELAIRDLDGIVHRFTPGVVVPGGTSLSIEVMQIERSFPLGEVIDIETIALSDLLLTMHWAVGELATAVGRFVQARLPLGKQ